MMRALTPTDQPSPRVEYLPGPVGGLVVTVPGISASSPTVRPSRGKNPLMPMRAPGKTSAVNPADGPRGSEYDGSPVMSLLYARDRVLSPTPTPTSTASSPMGPLSSEVLASAVAVVSPPASSSAATAFFF